MENTSIDGKWQRQQQPLNPFSFFVAVKIRKDYNFRFCEKVIPKSGTYCEPKKQELQNSKRGDNSVERV